MTSMDNTQPGRLQNVSPQHNDLFIFLLDYKPAERGKYIDAFFANINWDAVEERLQINASAPQQVTS
jgi:hypothetical protein